MAFENDHELVPYYKKFFYQRGTRRVFVWGLHSYDSLLRAWVVCCVLYVRRIVVCAEHENYWARHERLGPVLISIEGKSTRGSARLLRRGTPFRFRFRFRFSFSFRFVFPSNAVG